MKDDIAVSNPDGITERDILKFIKLSRKAEPPRTHFISRTEKRRQKSRTAAYRRQQEGKR